MNARQSNRSGRTSAGGLREPSMTACGDDSTVLPCSYDDIVNLEDGNLHKHDVLKVLTHLRDCSDCEEKLAKLRRMRRRIESLKPHSMVFWDRLPVAGRWHLFVAQEDGRAIQVALSAVPHDAPFVRAVDERFPTRLAVRRRSAVEPLAARLVSYLEGEYEESEVARIVAPEVLAELRGWRADVSRQTGDAARRPLTIDHVPVESVRS